MVKPVPLARPKPTRSDGVRAPYPRLGGQQQRTEPTGILVLWRGARHCSRAGRAALTPDAIHYQKTGPATLCVLACICGAVWCACTHLCLAKRTLISASAAMALVKLDLNWARHPSQTPIIGWMLLSSLNFLLAMM